MKFRNILKMSKTKYPDRNSPETKSNKKIKDNIYDMKGTLKESHETFSYIHYFFKYKIFVPGIWLIDKLLKKYYVKKIPNVPHHRNIRIFDKAYKEAMYKWVMLYRRNGHNPKKSISWWNWAMKLESNFSYFVPKVMKNLFITMIYYDTSYKELFNIFMHEITKEMMKEYSNKEKYPDGVGHLFYAQSDVYDVHYKFLYKFIQTRVAMSLSDAMEVFEQEKALEEQNRKNKRKTRRKTK